MSNYILNIAMVITTMWIVRRFWNIFYKKKKTSSWSVMIWMIFGLFQTYLHIRQEDADMLMTICNILLILLIAILGYHCTGKQKYFLVAAFSVVWALTEFLVFYVLNLILKPAESMYNMGAVITKIFMMIFVYVVTSYWSKERGEFVPHYYYLYLLFFPIGSIYISFSVFKDTKNHMLSSIVIMIILLIFNVTIFELYTKMNEMFMNECDKAVYAQQIDIISGNTTEQKRIMEEFYKEKHDLANELVSLKGYIEKGDIEGIIENLDIIIHNNQCAEKISDSGNSTVDAIINFKYTAASKLDIKFNLKIFIPNEFPIDVCDIGIVLGNAIDNAIEAVKKCKNAEKIIEISMGVKKEAWVVVIKNPYEHKIEKNWTGIPVSTKKEKHRHGYGLKSIMKIADKYQGEVVIETKDGLFSLIIVLNFREF
ncbi:MAG: GHKL domain-containing protein [Lachnospiraceae bacterium]